MVAIGSYYDDLEDAKQYSLALLEIATKILQQRPSATHKAKTNTRTDDLQTVVLLEILSTFCARQISASMSTRFRTLFANLSGSLDQPRSGLNNNPLAVFRTLGQSRTRDELNRAQSVWIETETRSRILHACSVLDSQQATLFDQPPTVRKHGFLKVNTAAVLKKVNLPCDDALWEASPVERWAEIAEKHDYIQLIGGQPTVPSGRQLQYSYFQQEVISANLEKPSSCAPERGSGMMPSGQVVFSKTVFNYHAMEMCRHTPIKHLLIVTGESWLLGRKIEKKDDYSRAKQELRKWLSNVSKKDSLESVHAHWHALKLLRCIEIPSTMNNANGDMFGTTNMLHENWAIYLACLVCWAHGHRKQAGHDSDPFYMTSPGIMSLNDPVEVVHDAKSYLTFADEAMPATLRDKEYEVLSRTQGLLQSVRTQKIAKNMMGGLMNDAEQVLLKLVEGKRSIAF